MLAKVQNNGTPERTKVPSIDSLKEGRKKEVNGEVQREGTVWKTLLEW